MPVTSPALEGSKRVLLSFASSPKAWWNEQSKHTRILKHSDANQTDKSSVLSTHLDIVLCYSETSSLASLFNETLSTHSFEHLSQKGRQWKNFREVIDSGWTCAPPRASATASKLLALASPATITARAWRRKSSPLIQRSKLIVQPKNLAMNLTTT